MDRVMKEYTVPGPAGDVTVQLSDEEAKARGLTSSSEVKAKTPANKQGSAANKGGAKAPSERQAAAAAAAFGAEKSQG